MKRVQRQLAIMITGFCYLVASYTLYAQDTKPVTGTVRNKADSSLLPGVTVMVKDHPENMTLTDSMGRFTLKLPAGATSLVFTNVSMQKLEQRIKGSSNFSIYLTPETAALEEIVVVGYGTQKKSLVTGAITSINQKDLEVPGLMRADQAIQGKAAGVTVMLNSGQPGSGVSIRIRGSGTNGSNDPLYIVDGYPVGDLESINPRDIETMEVLKDAASAAIYGARGANGVIIVTTKKGKAGKTRVEYDYYYGFQNAPKFLNVLDATQYARIVNEAFFNSNMTMPFSAEDISKFGKGTNWQREISYFNAPVQSHQLSLTSGTEKSTINASFSYFNQNGIFAKGKSQFERYTVRINAEQKYWNSILTAGQNVNITKVNRASIATNNGNAGPILSAINMDPITPVMNDNGSFAISRYVAQEIVNPIARIYYTNGQSGYTRVNGNAFGELRLMKNLKLKSTIGYTINYDESNGYTPIYYLNATNFTTATGVSKGVAIGNYMNLENTITYAAKLKAHSVTALLGNTVNTGNGTNVTGSKNGLLYEDPNFAYLDLAKDNTSAAASGGAWHSAFISYFGRVNYDFNGRLMATATLRADGSFRFGTNNRFGYFPSISVGWNLHKEAFMQNAVWINSLKLRGSWGQTGNDNIGDYKYVSTIGTYARSYYFGPNVQFVGASPNGVSNNDLKWEASEQTNIGIDGIVFKNFTVTVDLYSKQTKGLLVTIPIPAYVGNGSPTGNAGNIFNKGIELSVGYRKTVKALTYDITLNGAYNQNKVTYVGNASGFIVGSSANNQMSGVTRMEAGFPLGYFWLYTMDGIFQNQSAVNSYVNKNGGLIQPNAVPGDIRYKDLNGDGVIDNLDRSMVGSPHPKFNYGLNTSIRWKSFDVNIFLYGLAGNKIFNALRRWDLPTANYPNAILNRWHGEGTTNSYPRVSTGDLNGNFSNPSTFFLEDASFIRLKNVSVGYTFRNICHLTGSSLRLYITGTNLLLLTKYTGLDPEISGSALGLGIDKGVYPQPRTILFGLTVGF